MKVSANAVFHDRCQIPLFGRHAILSWIMSLCQQKTARSVSMAFKARCLKHLALKTALFASRYISCPTAWAALYLLLSESGPLDPLQLLLSASNLKQGPALVMHNQTAV